MVSTLYRAFNIHDKIKAKERQGNSMKIFESKYHGPCAICGKNEKIQTVIRKNNDGEEYAIDLCLDHLQIFLNVSHHINNNSHLCWFCQSPMIWQSDFSFEDYCMEGEGIIANLRCSNCGADAEYRLPLY